VVTGDFSYTSYDNGKSEMRYDLANDPQEHRNAADDPKYAEMITR
jgi:hypothetical protein